MTVTGRGKVCLERGVVHLPLIDYRACRWIYYYICDVCPVQHFIYHHLLSCRASLLFDQYTIILLGDRDACVSTTCTKSLCHVHCATVGRQTCDPRSEVWQRNHSACHHNTLWQQVQYLINDNALNEYNISGFINQCILCYWESQAELTWLSVESHVDKLLSQHACHQQAFPNLQLYTA